MLVICGFPPTHPPAGEPFGTGVLHVVNRGEVITVRSVAGILVSEIEHDWNRLLGPEAEVWFEKEGEVSH